jgi:hypothetical protein
MTSTLKKRITAMVAMVCLIVLASSTFAALLPSISVTGATGANSWLWFEAEDATVKGTFGTGTGQATQSGGGYIGRDGGVPTISYTAIPVIAAMSNAQFYARYVSWASKTSYTPVVGGVSSGALNIVGTGGFSAVPTTWSSATTVGSISAGNPTFSLTGDNVYDIIGYDGFYLASDALSAFGGLSGGWRQAPTFASVNTINAASVTPVISISGDVGGSTITLDGTPYVSGTPITTAGLHSLVIVSYGASGAGRVITGQTFNQVIPEPAALGLLAFGALGMLRRRNR